MTEYSIYNCTPRQTKKFICRALGAGIVPYIQGQPGIGKSQIVKEIAEEKGLELIDLRLSMCDPTDLMGIPHVNNNKASWVTFSDFPTEDTPIPRGKNGWILMLDELSSTNKSIQAAAYKLILDHMVGQKKLHSNCFVVAAGNRVEDRAVATSLSTALASRMLQINMEVSYHDWQTDVAFKRNLDYRIIGFLEMYPEHLNTFDPESESKTFCSPRTWEFTSWLIKNKDITDEDLPLLAGLLDPGVASEFLAFTKVFNKIVSYDLIKSDPDKAYNNTDIDDPELLYATSASIMQKITKDDLKNILKYINKLPQAFKLLVAKGIFHQHQDFLILKPASDFVAELSEQIN